MAMLDNAQTLNPIRVHPEENHHGKDEQKRNDALLGLCGSQLRTGIGNGFGRNSLFLVGQYVGVCATAEEIDQEADDERTAGYRESIAVAGRECCDIVVCECCYVCSGIHAVFRGGGNQFGCVFVSVKIIVAESRK